MTERREDKIPDNVDIVRISNTLYIRIPPKQREYLDIDENSTLKTQTEYSDKYGRYCSFWNPEQQDGEDQ